MGHTQRARIRTAIVRERVKRGRNRELQQDRTRSLVISARRGMGTQYRTINSSMIRDIMALDQHCKDRGIMDDMAECVDAFLLMIWDVIRMSHWEHLQFGSAGRW